MTSLSKQPTKQLVVGAPTAAQSIASGGHPERRKEEHASLDQLAQVEDIFLQLRIRFARIMQFVEEVLAEECREALA